MLSRKTWTSAGRPLTDFFEISLYSPLALTKCTSPWSTLVSSLSRSHATSASSQERRCPSPKKKKKNTAGGQSEREHQRMKDLFIYLPVYLFSLSPAMSTKSGTWQRRRSPPPPQPPRGDGRTRKICERGRLSEGGRVEAAWCRRSQNAVCLKKKKKNMSLLVWWVWMM